MKKLFFRLLLLFLVYYIIQYAYSLFSKGYVKDYKIINKYEFEVNEKYSSNEKGEYDNYFITVKVNGDEFYFQTFHDFNKQKKVVKNLHYYKNNNISCIYPEFIDNTQLFDVVCMKDGIYYNYSSFVDANKISDFVSSLKNYKKITNNLNNYETHNLIKIYTDNIVSNHYIGISNYRGVSIVKKGKNSNITDVKLFDRDIYKRPISFYISNYYVTADYTEKLYFSTFDVVDLTNGKARKLNFKEEISFDSYVLGVVGDSAYILDKTNKVEYEVDLSGFKVLAIGNVDTGVRVYENGTWKNIKMQDAIKKGVKFTYDTVDKNTIIHNQTSKKSGYIYYLTTNNNKCDVYKSSVQNDSKKTFLFTMSSCKNQVLYVDDYIYYIDKGNLNYYSDNLGVNTLLSYNELNFNNNIIIGGYKNTK